VKRHRWGTALLVPLALGVASSGGGCGASRVNECNDVIGIVNGGLKKLEEGGANADADKAEKVAYLRSMAATMDKLADDLSKSKTTIPELQAFSLRYQKLAKGVATAARDMADAVDQNDVAKHARAREALDKLADEEGPLVGDINQYCKG
jgi:hypothetical protein